MPRSNVLKAGGLLLGTGVVLVGALYAAGQALGALEAQRPLAFDQWIMESLRSTLGDGMQGPMLQLTALGGKTVVTLVSVLVFVALWLSKERLIALKVAIASAGAGLLTFGAKLLVERPRPGLVPWLDDWVGKSFSFPSGHSLASMAVYGSLGLLLSRLAPTPAAARFARGAGIGIALLVGVSRIYLGVHYPTDVLAGWAAGLLWALACWKALWWLRERNER